jgi:hypothetical protein
MVSQMFTQAEGLIAVTTMRLDAILTRSSNRIHVF